MHFSCQGFRLSPAQLWPLLVLQSVETKRPVMPCDAIVNYRCNSSSCLLSVFCPSVLVCLGSQRTRGHWTIGAQTWLPRRRVVHGPVSTRSPRNDQRPVRRVSLLSPTMFVRAVSSRPSFCAASINNVGVVGMRWFERDGELIVKKYMYVWLVQFMTLVLRCASLRLHEKMWRRRLTLRTCLYDKP